MKKVERLRGPRVFEAVRARGNVFDGQFLRFYYDFHQTRTVPIGFGIVMGRRHGSAVHRNRIKRRIRAACFEVLDTCADMLESKRAVLSVVIVFKGSKRRPLDRLSYAEIREDIANLAHVIQKSSAEIHGTIADFLGA